MNQAMHPPLLTLSAPAKINWSLYVVGRRDDGYHDILSLMNCIGLYDTLDFEPADGVELVSAMDVPAEQNLVFRAAVMLREYAGVKCGARISLEKEIPSGAGLGGGSSDAACALMGLNALWRLGLGREELKAVGARLGSDVPFFFECPAAVAEGRGDILTPLRTGASYTLLLVKPEVSISTAWAYGNLEQAELTKTEDKINNIKLIFDALKNRDISVLRSAVHNDFERTVIEHHSVIGDVREGLLKAGASLALMSGSGSTVFGLFEDRERAARASGLFPSCWNRVVETL